MRADPSACGGWLYLVILGFIGTAILTALSLIEALGQLSGLKAIMSAQSGPLAQLKAPLIATTSFGILAILMAIYCLYLMARKDIRIINTATLYYIVVVLAGLADVWADNELRAAVPDTPPDPSVVKEVIRGIVAAAIWIPYFHVSKRVRNTFLARRIASAASSNAAIPSPPIE